MLGALALAVSCGPGESSDSGEQATGDSTGSEPTTTGIDSSGEPWVAPLAGGGISVDWVQANQGVGVTIGADGGEVGGADRAAPLLQNRITLIRAFWTVPDDWQPRDIEGRLIVSWPDGTEETYSDTKLVEDAAFEGDLGRSFFWGLMADQTVAGVKYRVELYETDPQYDDLPGSGTPTLPAEAGATAFIGIEDSYQVLKTVVVPFIYDDGEGCSTTPDTSDDTMQLFQDLMYMQNPIERLDFTLHEPIEWNEPLQGFYQLNQFMAGLRFDEGASPETYYYGLVDVCDSGLGGAGGQAIDIPTDPVNPDAASSRVSSGLSLGADWSAETFVHEVGHSQGRRHVACNGEEAGANPSYPHKGGDVGEWGFGVIDFGLRHPTFYKDYMTYCHPTWVGTWGWNKVYPVIRGLSEWDTGEGKPGAGGAHAIVPGQAPYSGSMLLGTVGPAGDTTWITVPGALTHPVDPGTTVRFSGGTRTVAELAAYVHRAQDGDATTIMVPLPTNWAAVDRVSWDQQGTRRFTPRSEIAEHHGQRRLRAPQ